MPLRPKKLAGVVPTATRLPTAHDGAKVFAREHGSRHWYPTDWAYVTRPLHAEWAPIPKKESTA